jgi:hypothetical protein
VREWYEGKDMNPDRGAGVGYALISRGVVVFGEPCRFGHVGYGGRPWLVGWDSGGVRWGQEGGWLA